MIPNRHSTAIWGELDTVAVAQISVGERCDDFFVKKVVGKTNMEGENTVSKWNSCAKQVSLRLCITNNCIIKHAEDKGKKRKTEHLNFIISFYLDTEVTRNVGDYGSLSEQTKIRDKHTLMDWLEVKKSTLQRTVVKVLRELFSLR